MIRAIFFILLLVHGVCNTLYAVSPDRYVISSGTYHTCALDDNGVTCWGDNYYGQTDVPTLSNPTQVSLGRNHTCVLDDNGVICWGNNGTGQTDVPTLSNPTQVSLGSVHTCALDDNGVTCWGDKYNDNGQTDVPTLSNPTQISSGGLHACALDDNGVTCWGHNNFGQSSVPTSLSFTYPSTHQVPHPLWLYGILLAGLGILGVRSISRSRA